MKKELFKWKFVSLSHRRTWTSLLSDPAGSGFRVNWTCKCINSFLYIPSFQQSYCADSFSPSHHSAALGNRRITSQISVRKRYCHCSHPIRIPSDFYLVYSCRKCNLEFRPDCKLGSPRGQLRQTIWRRRRHFHDWLFEWNREREIEAKTKLKALKLKTSSCMMYKSIGW